MRQRRNDQGLTSTDFGSKMDSSLSQKSQSLSQTRNNRSNSVCMKRRSTSSKSRRCFLLLIVLCTTFIVMGINGFVKGWKNRNKADPLKNKVPTFHNATSSFVESTHRLPRATANVNGYVQNHHIQKKHRFVCSLRNTSKSTTLDSDKTHALARFIVFQSNGAHQLLNLMTYYTQVISIEHMVIINHQTSPSNANPRTNILLDEYSSRGADVWDCVGGFNYKDEMWSRVTHRYTDVSDFVFPIDIDEYIAVLTPSTSSLSTSADVSNQTLSWSKEHLLEALRKLKDTGRPFKMERGNVYPIDCSGIPQWEGEPSPISDTKNPIQNQKQNQNSNQNNYERSVIERLQYVARRKYDRVDCKDKVFFRGKDFNFTDTGNHFGQTHIQKTWQSQRRCLIRLKQKEKFIYKKYVQDTYSDLFMVHMQFTTMEEWLMHGLRGASDRGFNRFDLKKDCRGTSHHYCEKWKMLMETNFDPRKIQRLYREKVCASVVNGKIPVPIAQILTASH